MFKQTIQKNDITIEKTIAVLEQWKEKVVTLVHRGNIIASRASSRLRDDVAGDLKERRYVLNKTRRHSEKFKSIALHNAIATLTGINYEPIDKIPHTSYVGNCQELSEIMMAIIMLGADQLKCPMECEIIIIPDPHDTIVAGAGYGTNGHVLVRLTYPDDESNENTIIIDPWAKDVYKFTDIDKEPMIGIASKHAAATRQLYKAGLQNDILEISDSWNTTDNKLIHREFICVGKDDLYIKAENNLRINRREDLEEFIIQHDIISAYILAHNQEKNRLLFYVIEAGRCIFSVELKATTDAKLSEIIDQLNLNKDANDKILADKTNILISKVFVPQYFDDNAINTALKYISKLKSFQSLDLFTEAVTVTVSSPCNRQ